MRPIVIALTVASALAVAGGLFMMIHHDKAPASRFMTTSPAQDAWTNWKMTNGKSYGTSSEENYRFNSFVQNMNLVSSFDTKKNTFTIGLNKFADMTFAEFKNVYLGTKIPEKVRVETYSSMTAELPESVDWTGKAVTGVKDQAQCGSCWAFSATGGAEGAYAVKNGSIKSFSEQQLVDCAGGSYGNQGCNGGLMDQAFDYMKVKGSMLESDYRYTAMDGTCRFDASEVAFTISGYTDVPVDNNEELMKAVVKQPVSVAIDADNTFQLYTGGVYNHWSCGTQLDHGVLLVGYGSDNGADFYKIKNSWGSSWGEEGYIRFGRKMTGVGMCGITKQASYPQA